MEHVTNGESLDQGRGELRQRLRKQLLISHVRLFRSPELLPTFRHCGLAGQGPTSGHGRANVTKGSCGRRHRPRLRTRPFPDLKGISRDRAAGGSQPRSRRSRLARQRQIASCWRPGPHVQAARGGEVRFCVHGQDPGSDRRDRLRCRSVAQPEGRLPYPACLPFLLVTWRHDVGAEGLTGDAAGSGAENALNRSAPTRRGLEVAHPQPGPSHSEDRGSVWWEIPDLTPVWVSPGSG